MSWEKGAPRSRRQAVKDGVLGTLEALAGAGIALGVARHAPEWLQQRNHSSALPTIAVGGAAGLMMDGLERMFNRYYVPAHAGDYSAKRMEETLRNNHHKLASAARYVEDVVRQYAQRRRESRQYGAPMGQFAMAY